MTPEQLAPYEPAARIYCAHTGFDPDQIVKRPHPILLGTTIDAPLWHGVAEQMAELSTLLAAMKTANAARQTH